MTMQRKRILRTPRPNITVTIAINETLIKKLIEMNEEEREKWFKNNQAKIDFMVFNQVCSRMKTKALSFKEDSGLYKEIMNVQSHGQSWEPLN